MKFNIVKEVGLCGDRSNENKKFRTQVSDGSANSNGQDFLILPPLPCSSSCCCHVFIVFPSSPSSNQIVVMQKISPAPTTTLAFTLTRPRSRNTPLHALDERGGETTHFRERVRRGRVISRMAEKEEEDDEERGA